MKYYLKPNLPSLLVLLTIFAFTSPGMANAEAEKKIKVKQVFPFLNKYLTLPASVRDGFKLVYAVRATPGPLPEMNYFHNNRRIRINTAPDGTVTNPPDLAIWEDGIIESPTPKPAGTRISISMNSIPNIPLGTNINVSAVTNSIGDLKEAVKSAGPIALAFPKQESIVFKGAQTGFIVFANGHRIPMARAGGGLIFSPLKREMRGATSLNFNTAPSSADFAR